MTIATSLFAVVMGFQLLPETTGATQELRQVGVIVTRDGLVMALTHRESRIRVLAASVLADLKEWNTAGAIAKAAEAERATAARVSLTTSWARLDKTGVAKLARMCRGDGSISGLGRLYASQALQDHFASEECFDSLVRFVGTPSKADEIPRAEIALTLDSYKQSLTDPGKRRLAIKALSQLLRAEDSYTRVAAATALFNIGDPAGLVPLTEAVAREHSSGLQNILQGILSDLQARTRPVKQP